MKNSVQEAFNFIKQQLDKVKLTRETERQIIVSAMKRFGLSEQTVAELLRDAMGEVRSLP